MDRQNTPRLAGLKPVPLQILYELTLLIDPPPVPVPGSDKVMVFNNPQAAEMLRRVSEKVRELIDFEAPAPDALDAERYRYLRRIGGATWKMTSPDNPFASRRATGAAYDQLVDQERATSMRGFETDWRITP